MANSQKVSLVSDNDGVADIEVKVVNQPTSIKINNTAASPIPVTIPQDFGLITDPSFTNLFVSVKAVSQSSTINDRFNFPTKIIDWTSLQQFCKALWTYYYVDGTDHSQHTMYIDLYVINSGIPSSFYYYCTYSVQNGTISGFTFSAVTLT